MLRQVSFNILSTVKLDTQVIMITGISNSNILYKTHTHITLPLAAIFHQHMRRYHGNKSICHIGSATTLDAKNSNTN
jgi:hypothetical protein